MRCFALEKNVFKMTLKDCELSVFRRQSFEKDVFVVKPRLISIHIAARPNFDQMTLVQLVEPAKQIPITDDDGEGNDEELPSCNCAAFLIKIGHGLAWPGHQHHAMRHAADEGPCHISQHSATGCSIYGF